MTAPTACLDSPQATTCEREKLGSSGAGMQSQASVRSDTLTCLPQRPASSLVAGDGSQETQVQV